MNRYKMQTLDMHNTIKRGAYAGETVYDCIKNYGRKSILEILKYYNLDNHILKTYHFHSIGEHKETPINRNSSGDIAENTSTTITLYSGEDGDYLGDDIWMMNINSDINDPWELNEMQYPYEMEKCCYEIDLTEEETI